MVHEPEPQPEPEIHITELAFTEDTDPERKVFDWDVLLGPASPFVFPPPNLAQAVRQLDGWRALKIISEERLLSSDHFDAVWATTRFLEYARARNRRWAKEETRLVEEVEARIGGDRLNHARRLATLLYGISVGSLSESNYGEVEDFLRYLLTQERASAILAGIRRRPAPTSIIQAVIDVFGLARRRLDKIEELPVIPAPMPTMTQQFGPKENHGLRD